MYAFSVPFPGMCESFSLLSLIWKVVLDNPQDFILSYVLHFLVRIFSGFSYTPGIAPGVHTLVTEDEQETCTMAVVFHALCKHKADTSKCPMEEAKHFHYTSSLENVRGIGTFLRFMTVFCGCHGKEKGWGNG